MNNNENEENKINEGMPISEGNNQTIPNNENLGMEMPAPASGTVNNDSTSVEMPLPVANNPLPQAESVPVSQDVSPFPTQNVATNNQQQAVGNQSIINTDAVKAQTNKLLDGVKNVENELNQKIKTDKRVLYILIAGAFVVFIIGVIFVSNILFSPAKSAVKTYLNAMKNYDAKKIVKCYHPKMVETMEDYLTSYDDLIEYYEDYFDEKKDDDYKILSYEIDNDYKKYDKDDIEDLAETLEDSYDINEKDVKDARRYSVKIKVDDDGDKDTEKSKIVVVKIKNKWYIFS